MFHYQLISVVALTLLTANTQALAFQASSGAIACNVPLHQAPCNADLDYDGSVNIDDLLLVVEEWGNENFQVRPTADCAPLDNGDCLVNISDLLMILEYYGTDTSDICIPCPVGEIQDCYGNCAPAVWVGDAYCDDGSYLHNGQNIYFNCPEFNCDEGDCAETNCNGEMLGACWLPSNTCSVMTGGECTNAAGLMWIPNTDCTDTDQDRIPDVFELNTCSDPNNGYTGTDPLLADTDGDGLLDGDEIYGTLDGLDLPGFGCDACHKDLLIEVDWISGADEEDDRNRLHPNQAARVVTAYANSTLTNPDGIDGVKVHIDIGQAPYEGGNAATDPAGDGNVEIGGPGVRLSGGEMPVIKSNNFDASRQGYFHYCVMANSISNIPDEGQPPVILGFSGIADLPGDDFVVSVGSWPITGDDDRIGNTFMHELGHNMNLKHAGATHTPNFKPNYNSVMNYAFQLCGVDTNGDGIPDGGLDYARNENIDLNEGALFESLGVTGFGPAIDWNGNGVIDKNAVTRNINCRAGGCSSRNAFGCGDSVPSNTCGDTSCTALDDNDDWAQLSFTGILGLTESDGVLCDPLSVQDNQ